MIERVIGHLKEASQVLPDIAQGEFYTFDTVITAATGALAVVNPNSVTVPGTHDFLMHGISGYYQRQVDATAPAGAGAIDVEGIPLITAQVNYQGGDKGRIFNQAFNFAQLVGSDGSRKDMWLPMQFLFPASSVISITFTVQAAAWVALGFPQATKNIGVAVFGTLVGRGIKTTVVSQQGSVQNP